jgi:hypothetical protein
MLSRAQYNDNVANSDNEEVHEDFFTSEFICRVGVIQEFRVENYEDKNLMIGKTIQELEQEKGHPYDKERKTKI